MQMRPIDRLMAVPHEARVGFSTAKDGDGSGDWQSRGWPSLSPLSAQNREYTQAGGRVHGYRQIPSLTKIATLPVGRHKDDEGETLFFTCGRPLPP
jgi:hypothetical protein